MTLHNVVVDLPGVLICALATWRLSHAITREDGPWGLLRRFRTRFPLGGLSACIYCTSFWVAPVVLVGWVTVPLLVLAIAIGAAGLMLMSYTGVGRD